MSIAEAARRGQGLLEFGTWLETDYAAMATDP